MLGLPNEIVSKCTDQIQVSVNNMYTCSFERRYISCTCIMIVQIWFDQRQTYNLTSTCALYCKCTCIV